MSLFSPDRSYGFKIFTESGELAFEDTDMISFIYAEGVISSSSFVSIGGSNAPNYSFSGSIQEPTIFLDNKLNRKSPLVFLSPPVGCAVHSINIAPEFTTPTPYSLSNFNLFFVSSVAVDIPYKVVVPIQDIHQTNLNLLEDYGLLIYNATNELIFTSAIQSANITNYIVGSFNQTILTGLHGPSYSITVPEIAEFPDAEPYFCINTIGYIGNINDAYINSCYIKRDSTNNFTFTANVYNPTSFRGNYPDPTRIAFTPERTAFFGRL